MTHLQVGQEIPNFKALNEKEEIVNNASLLGKKQVLFFYPKDDTPGCTKAACSIRDNYKALKKKDYKIFGVSPDKVKKHQKFIDKYEFQYSLLADPEKVTINSFGLWGPKKFMGKVYDGIHRSTFIIDENGIIERIIEKVKTKDHSNQILNKE